MRQSVFAFIDFVLFGGIPKHILIELLLITRCLSRDIPPLRRSTFSHFITSSKNERELVRLADSNYISVCFARNIAPAETSFCSVSVGTPSFCMSDMTAPTTSPSAIIGEKHEILPSPPSVSSIAVLTFAAEYSRRLAMSDERDSETGFSRYSLRDGVPATAMMLSLSQMAIGYPPLLLIASAHCADAAEMSPIGEYFLKIISQSFSVYISSGSPPLITLTRKTLSAWFFAD